MSSPPQRHEPATATPAQRQALINGVWDTARRALLMIGNALLDFGEICRSRDASVLGDVFIAAAGAIERRMR